MTGTTRWPRLTMACNDGKIFLKARSPVAPKKTKASDWDVLIVSSSFETLRAGLLLNVLAELELHRGQQLVGKLRRAPRAESRVQRRTQHRDRNRFIVGGGGPDCPGNTSC